MYLLKLFRDWFFENVAEFDREGLSREVIAQKAFIAGFNAAQQSTHADGACPKCGAEGYVILGDGRKYCNVCKTPRR